VPLVGRAPVAELDVADALAVATFVTQRVAGAFANSFPFPLAHGPHDGDHHYILSTAKRPRKRPAVADGPP
jgi:hypothetical protein